MFYPGSYKDGTYNDDYNSTEVPEGVANFNPKAGDVVVISELVVHGALSWQPKDRQRRFLTLRYCSQHIPASNPLPEGVKARLSPETLELIEVAPFQKIKSIVQQESAVGSA